MQARSAVGAIYRASTAPLYIGLLLFGFLCIVGADIVDYGNRRLVFVSCGLLTYSSVMLAWAIGRKIESLQRPTILVATLAVYLYAFWLTPGAVYFATIPVVIGWGIAGKRGGIASTLLLTLLFLFQQETLNLSSQVSHTAVAAIWLITLIMWLIYRPILEVIAWSWEEYDKGLRVVEEARAHAAHMNEVMDELRHANHQFDLLNERLFHTRLMLEDANRAKADFVAKVSHEFRTPLNIIIGLTDLLVNVSTSPNAGLPDAGLPDAGLPDAGLPDAVAQDIHIIHRNCVHLASMVNDVLDISQTESGRLTLRREWVDLAVEVGEAMEVVRPLALRRNLFLNATIPEDLPAVYCDRTRIRQVLLNLMSNAARYTEEGGIQVTVTCDEQVVTVQVADSGAGIRPDDAARIFEPFYQGDVIGYREGSGLGLTISRQFIELHHGTIWVESTLGKGSTFFFTLPIAPYAPPVSHSGRWVNEDWGYVERPNPGIHATHEHKHRLVVYDVNHEIEAELQIANPEVTVEGVDSIDRAAEALAGLPAHALLLNHRDPYVLIEMVDEARGRIDDTPILGVCIPPTYSHALEAGALNFMLKPVTRADLQKALFPEGKSPRHILHVDDDGEYRKLMARMIRAIAPDVKMSEASGVNEALQLLRERKGDSLPDHILLDLGMPLNDGWTFLEERKLLEALRDIPVTILSAQDPPEIEETPFIIAAVSRALPAAQLWEYVREIGALLAKPALTRKFAGKALATEKTAEGAIAGEAERGMA